MQRALLIAALVFAAFSCTNAQTPTETGPGATGPLVIAPNPVITAFAPLEAPVAPVEVPVAVPPSPIADLLVTPQQINETLTMIKAMYDSSPAVQAACTSPQLLTDYYALSTVNCDRAQTTQGTAPATSCPAACKTGVETVGANCTAALNYAYLTDIAAQEGADFKIEDFDPSGTLKICGVTLDETEKSKAFELGQLEFFFNALGAAGVNVPECDLGGLESGSFPEQKAECVATATVGACAPACSAAVATAGPACLNALARATIQQFPAFYSAQIKVFEVCGISANPAPAPAPIAPLPSPVPAPDPAPAPVPVSSAPTLSLSAVASFIGFAILLL